jgi:hypothetical protein
MDADDAAFIFASAFEEQGVHFSTVVHPLFADDAGHAQSIMKDHCPFHPDGQWKTPEPPTRSVVGVGVVDPKSGHRIADLYRQGIRPDLVPHLLSAADALKAIIRDVERRSLPYFGDVVNRYFPALCLPRELENVSLADREAEYIRLIEKLDMFNRRVVAANWSHLRASRGVTAVAGGSFKFHVIWSLCITGLLNRSNRIISELHTDSDTASRLLKALEEFEQASPKMREWYRTVTKLMCVDTSLQNMAPAVKSGPRVRSTSKDARHRGTHRIDS